MCEGVGRRRLSADAPVPGADRAWVRRLATGKALPLVISCNYVVFGRQAGAYLAGSEIGEGSGRCPGDLDGGGVQLWRDQKAGIVCWDSSGATPVWVAVSRAKIDVGIEHWATMPSQPFIECGTHPGPEPSPPSIPSALWKNRKVMVLLIASSFAGIYRCEACGFKVGGTLQ
jgi:hypothetical protein